MGQAGTGPGVLLGLALGLLLWAAPAAAQTAALQLVLAVDASGSVDDVEYRLQMDGLAAAFRDPEVVAAIDAAGLGGIAVTLVLWGCAGTQLVAVPWTRIVDGAGAAALAARIEGERRLVLDDCTAVGSAIAFGLVHIAASPIRGRRAVIDVSGDGVSNHGPPPAPVRDRAVAAGVTVNGVAILAEDPQLDAYYRKNVIGGPGAFLEVATDHVDFAHAIRRKLIREIRGDAVALRAGPRRPED